MTYKASNYSNAISFYSLCLNLLMFMGFACVTLSLFLPVLFTSADDIYGFWVLITGWMASFFFQFAWFANPINLLAILLNKEHPLMAVLLSLLALLIASETFVFMEIPTGINQQKIFITELGLGFYFWYAAQCFFLLALLSRYVGTLKRK